jgi:hypothetical protein
MGLESRMENHKETTASFTKKEVQAQLEGLLDIYAWYRDRCMLPHQGSNPAVTPHSLKIGHDIQILKTEIKEWKT